MRIVAERMATVELDLGDGPHGWELDTGAFSSDWRTVPSEGREAEV